MKVYLWEFGVIGVIMGVLWAVVPWRPLNEFECILAGIYLVIFSCGILALIEQAALTVWAWLKEWRIR